jgi:hypothetical protein
MAGRGSNFATRLRLPSPAGTIYTVKANTKYLLKRYAVVPLGCAYLIFIVIGLLRQGKYTLVIAFAALIAIVASLFVLWVRRKALLAFKYPTPDRAIALYHGFTPRNSHSEALVAYNSAFAAALYGEFDRAREELASINWSTLPPMYKGFETYIFSLLAILEAHDYSRALTLAKEARDLCDVSDNFPGAKTSRVALEANVAVCELLAGNDGSALLAQLDSASRKLPGVSAAIPAWALAVHHTRADQPAEARRYAAVVTRLVPHCTPLMTVPRSGIVRKLD